MPFRRGSSLLSHLSPNKWKKRAPGEGGGPLGSLETVRFGCRWPWSIPAEIGRRSRAACPSSCPAPSGTAGLEMPPAPAAGSPGWDRAAPKRPQESLRSRGLLLIQPLQGHLRRSVLPAASTNAFALHRQVWSFPKPLGNKTPRQGACQPTVDSVCAIKAGLHAPVLEGEEDENK